MKIQLHALRSVVVVAITSLSCRANPKDDQFARSFIDRIARRDSSIAVLFEPASDISRASWKNLITVADRLPAAPADSIRLVEWERGKNQIGPYRKLTYLIDRGSKETRVELWLVSHNGQTYVNTVRAIEMVPDTATD